MEFFKALVGILGHILLCCVIGFPIIFGAGYLEHTKNIPYNLTLGVFVIVLIIVCALLKSYL